MATSHRDFRYTPINTNFGSGSPSSSAARGNDLLQSAEYLRSILGGMQNQAETNAMNQGIASILGAGSTVDAQQAADQLFRDSQADPKALIGAQGYQNLLNASEMVRARNEENAARELLQQAGSIQNLGQMQDRVAAVQGTADITSNAINQFRNAAQANIKQEDENTFRRLSPEALAVMDAAGVDAYARALRNPELNLSESVINRLTEMANLSSSSTGDLAIDAANRDIASIMAMARMEDVPYLLQQASDRATDPRAKARYDDALGKSNNAARAAIPATAATGTGTGSVAVAKTPLSDPDSPTVRNAKPMFGSLSTGSSAPTGSGSTGTGSSGGVTVRRSVASDPQGGTPFMTRNHGNTDFGAAFSEAQQTIQRGIEAGIFTPAMVQTLQGMDFTNIDPNLNEAGLTSLTSDVWARSIRSENSGRDAVSPTGARGFGQLTKGTFESLRKLYPGMFSADDHTKLTDADQMMGIMLHHADATKYLTNKGYPVTNIGAGAYYFGGPSLVSAMYGYDRNTKISDISNQGIRNGVELAYKHNGHIVGKKGTGKDFKDLTVGDLFTAMEKTPYGRGNGSHFNLPQAGDQTEGIPLANARNDLVDAARPGSKKEEEDPSKPKVMPTPRSWGEYSRQKEDIQAGFDEAFSRATNNQLVTPQLIADMRKLATSDNVAELVDKLKTRMPQIKQEDLSDVLGKLRVDHNLDLPIVAAAAVRMYESEPSKFGKDPKALLKETSRSLTTMKSSDDPGNAAVRQQREIFTKRKEFQEQMALYEQTSNALQTQMGQLVNSIPAAYAVTGGPEEYMKQSKPFRDKMNTLKAQIAAAEKEHLMALRGYYNDLQPGGVAYVPKTPKIKEREHTGSVSDPAPEEVLQQYAGRQAVPENTNPMVAASMMNMGFLPRGQLDRATELIAQAAATEPATQQAQPTMSPKEAQMRIQQILQGSLGNRLLGEAGLPDGLPVPARSNKIPLRSSVFGN